MAIRGSRLSLEDQLVAQLAAQQAPFVPIPAYNLIYGSNLADDIVGTFGSDMILAAGGDDTVASGFASDILDGESGDD